MSGNMSIVAGDGVLSEPIKEGVNMATRQITGELLRRSVQVGRQWMSVLCLASVLTCLNAGADGVTIITHGWNSGTTDWIAAMRDAVDQKRLTNEQRYGTIVVTGGLTGSPSAECSPWTVSLQTSSSGEILIALDWSDIDVNGPEGRSTIDVAAAVVDTIATGQNGQPPLAELPIHLVGHSRGGSLVCEIARLLGERGIWVDHLTTLDPHPLIYGLRREFIITDAPARVYENVLFADNYWRSAAPAADFDGRYVAGAMNRELSVLDDEAFAGNNQGYYYSHSDVHLWYHGTIDTTSGASNGEQTITTTMRDSWWTAEEDGGSKTGFYFSRIVGGDRPASGVSSSEGGNAGRMVLSWSGAVWPNIINLDVLQGGSSLATGTHSVTVGQALELRYKGQDRDSQSTVSLWLDTDRNPYNGDVGLVSSETQEAGGFQETLNWTTSSMSPGTDCYVYAKITDGTRTRYFYAQPRLHFVAAQPVFHLVTATCYANGSVTPQSVLVEHGHDQQFNANPADGYIVDRWYLDGYPDRTGGSTYVVPNVQTTHWVLVSMKQYNGTITIIEPNGGEAYLERARVAIQWQPADAHPVNIHLSTDGGGTFPYSLATSATGSLINSTRYETVSLPSLPPDITRMEHCRIRITKTDGSVTGMSAGDFWIVGGTQSSMSWGYNNNGQLGNGNKVDQPSPVQSTTLTNAVAVAGGSEHSLALLADGTVKAWGDGGYGQLGTGDTSDYPAPTAVKGVDNVGTLDHVKAIAAAGFYSLALLEDGTVIQWGRGAGGISDWPVRIAGLSNVVAVAAGGTADYPGETHALALLGDGTIRAWGSNFHGQLGDNSTTPSDTPVAVSGVTDAVAIAAGGEHSLAVLRDGTVRAWGWNYRGQLGDGTTNEHHLPVPVLVVTGARLVAAGANHSIALVDKQGNKEVWAWGDNRTGQVGKGTWSPDQFTPEVVYGGVVGVACGENHTVALDAGGTVETWGENQYGQLGLGLPLVNRNQRVQVTLAGNVGYVAAGEMHTLTIARQRTAAWTTITSAPEGLPFQVDGITYVTPWSFPWYPDANCSVTFTEVQTLGQDTYRFTGWSDGLNTNPRAVPGSGSTYTAVFSDQPIAQENHAPVAANAQVSATTGTPFHGLLAASDVDGDSLSFNLVDLPSQGTVQITDNLTGAFTYTANVAASGPDQFTFRAYDGAAYSEPATVTVTVTPVPTIASLSPPNGPAGGGNSVTITGTNLDNAIDVAFDSVLAGITSRTATQIVAIAPLGTAGTTVDVTVTTLAGGSANTTGDDYTYDAVDDAPPTVTDKSPAAGATVSSSSAIISVTFSEFVTGVDASDLVLSGTAAASATKGSATNTAGNTWHFPINGLANGTINVSLAPDANDIEDAAGNDLANVTWSYTVSIADNGLVARWPFDGDANDVSGNGHNGTLNGGATCVETVPPRDGGSHALALDGNGDYVRIPNNMTLSPDSVTVQTWARPDALGFVRVADCNISSGAGFELGIYNSGGYRFYFQKNAKSGGTAVDGVVEALNTVTAGTWYHLAGVYDKTAGKVRLYVDGVLQHETDLLSDAQDSTIPDLIIGASTGTSPSAFFTGLIDEVRIYDYARTAEQIAADAQQQPSVTIAANDANAAEPSDTGTFTVVRTGATTAALTVNLTTGGGTATNGTDYQTIGNTVTIPAGQASATVTVTPINDSAVEGSETVILTVATGTGYTVGTSSSAMVTIADDDTPHLADTNGDGTITNDELNVYAGQWKAGTNENINHLTRAGQIVKQGGTYHYVAGAEPACWVPGSR